MSQLKIILGTTGGNSVSVDVRPDDTCRMLRERIQIESGLDEEFDMSQIFDDGKQFEEDDNVYDLLFRAAQATHKSQEENTRVCVVDSCVNSKLPDPNIEIFDFPLETARYSTWLLACNRHDLLGRIPISLNSEFGVCADHFPDSCFLNGSMNRRLRKNATPVLEERQSSYSILAQDMIIPSVKLEDGISLNDCTNENTSEGYHQDTENSTVILEEENVLRKSSQISEVNSVQDEADEEDLQEDELEELEEDEEEEENVILETETLEHPGLICRLCAQAVDTAHFIFSEKGREEKIFDKISSSLPINIHCDDPLPKQVCGQCLSVLNTCYNFSKACVKADRKLHKMMPRFRCQKDSQIALQKLTVEIGQPKDMKEIQETDEDSSPCYDCPLCCEGQMESQDQVNISEIEGKDPQDSEDVVQDFLADSVLWEDGEDFLENDQNFIEGEDDLSDIHDSDDCHPCLICGASFISLAHLFEHSERHQDSESHQCGHCALVFNSKENLVVHLDLVMASTGEELYKCGTCGKLFTSEKRAEFHHEVAHGISALSSLSCPECGQIFSNETNLWDHLQIEHKGQKPYSCPKCEKTFHIRAQLRTHMRSHEYNTTFDCAVCSISFPDRLSLRSHQATHTEDKMFQCEHCGRCFTRKYLLTAHARSHVNKKPRVYTCRVCGEDGFETLNKLLMHRRSAHKDVMLPLGSKKEKLHKCDQCNKSFAGRVALKHHILSHNGNLPHVCEFCNKGFTQKRSLLLHRRTHTGEKPFQCGECGKRFVQSAHLYSHLRLHTGEKPYPCSDCGATFRLKDVRDSHQRKHTGERPFKCKVCDKSFRTSHSYYQHTWIHTGRKPYPCDYCGKAFRRSNGLKVHIRIHTGEKPHKCDVCGRGFAQKQDMRKHRNLHTIGRL